MPCRRYVLYMAWSPDKYRIGISAIPRVDFSYLQNTEGYQGMAFISPPLPLALCEYLMAVFSTQQERIGKPYRNLKIPFIKSSKNYPHSILRHKFKQVKKLLERYGDDYLAHEPVIFNGEGEPVDYFTLHQYEDIVEYILQGKILFLREIQRLLQDQGLESDDLEVILHLLTLKGQVVRVPSVKWTADGAVACNRCGQQYRVVKAFCNEGQKECYYCQECLMLGESKPCEALYAAPARVRPEERMVSSIRLNLDISFSQAQYEAFEVLVRFIRRDSLNECLVWEACGAGRPETVFGAVREVLKRGGRVLFGVPRRDVLDDLVSRLERAFPGVSVEVRYGRPRSNNSKNSDIVLASTHHALRFYSSFDLVVLDESDAFPYRANPILINALRRAKKKEGKLIYITPTPAPDIYARAQRGEIKVVQIPIRQHGHPLVIPRVVMEKDIVLEDKLSDKVVQLIRESIEEDQAQVLVVVPNGYLSSRVGELLLSRLEALNLQGLRERPIIYTGAHDPERDKKVDAYFRGEANILITTGLTGRGDLAPSSNMVVLWSDNEIFDEGYLLQLAGRVGWSESYPGGKVWFVGARITREMEGAIRKIRLLNEEAQKRGYLENQKLRYNRVQR